MQLTLFSDYALRTLIYLGSHPERVVPSSQISDAYGVSSDHMAKVTKWLTQRGYVHAQRGKTGGLTLARTPASIRVGQLILETEPHMNLLECFELETNTCPLVPACKLKRALVEARSAFVAALDAYTLADLLSNRPQLVQLLGARAP
ncbi:MAG TPA: Rrf2 family transcriptional regulator [Polyangiales bacterium]|nr:Rrf2 family transcriptional regulator [Polyangiales bacterium]